ncbi:MAG: hypothetical protein [Cotesia congregata filamentous virus 2]
MLCKLLENTIIDKTQLPGYITDNFEHLITLIYPMLGYKNVDYTDNEITFGPPFGEFNIINNNAAATDNIEDENNSNNAADDYNNDYNEHVDKDCVRNKRNKAQYIKNTNDNNNNDDDDRNDGNEEEGAYANYGDLSRVRANRKYKERRYKSMEDLYYSRHDDFPIFYRHEFLEKSKNNKQIKSFIDWLKNTSSKFQKKELNIITRFAQLDTINYKLTLNTFIKLCSIANLTIQDYIYINNYFNFNNKTFQLSFADRQYLVDNQ